MIFLELDKKVKEKIFNFKFCYVVQVLTPCSTREKHKKKAF